MTAGIEETDSLDVTPPRAAPAFSVISGAQVHRVLAGHERRVTDIVRDAYRVHCAGDSVNPPSYFLRFPERPSDRIIALPASIGGELRVHGIKWISSFPGNVASGLPRASAVLILNDYVSGYPFACLESSIISATRTAAFAASAADQLSRERSRPRRLGFFGTGLIARYVHTYLAANGWDFDEVSVHDVSAESAAGLAGYLGRVDAAPRVQIHETAEALIRASDLIVFATTSGTPHVKEPAWFDHHPIVLHISLRDLAPEILLEAVNVVDDVEHCLKANTSPHLVEQLTGSRDFLTGTLGDVEAGHVRVPPQSTVVCSPFGLGVLDLAVGMHVYDSVSRAGELQVVDGFFHDLSRHG